MEKNKLVPEILVLVFLVCAGLLAFVCVVYFKECRVEDKREAPVCRHDQDIQFVKLPVDTLLTKYDFESDVVGQKMSRIYSILAEPLAFIPSKNFFVKISKVGQSSSYNRTAIGDDFTKHECYRSAWTFKQVEEQPDRAMFHYRSNNKDYLLTYFSSCASKYFWMAACSDYHKDKLEQLECPLSKSILGLYVRGNLNDISLFDMANDLHETTNVKFGVAKLRWFFTFGHGTTLC